MRLPSGINPREAKVRILEIGPLHDFLRGRWWGGWLTVGIAEGGRQVVVPLRPGSLVTSGRGQYDFRY
jgi:hypothetical protein